MYKKEKQQIALLENKIAEFESYPSLNEAQVDVLKEMKSTVFDLKMSLPEKPLTLQDCLYNGQDRITSGGTGRGRGSIKGPMDKKDYHSLHGSNDGYHWPDKDSSFFDVMFTGRFHPGLIKNSMSETVPSDGGFLVPVEYSSQIHNVALENEIIMPRCFVQPMKSNECHIPAMSIGNHSTNLYGGFTASYTGEAGTINEANPKCRDMELNAKKLTGLIRFSGELAADIPGGTNQIINICGKGLAWYRDRAFLKGSGVGEPLGILNAPCTITVAKEGGQGADTLVYENFTKMIGRLHPACFNNSIWIIQVSAIPMLLQLSMAIGLGGNAIPVLSESGGVWKILTRPVIFTEKT